MGGSAFALSLSCFLFFLFGFVFAGGKDKIETLFRRFYEKVPKDAVLQPVFAKMPSHHAKIVASFVAEVFGGPV